MTELVNENPMIFEVQETVLEEDFDDSITNEISAFEVFQLIKE